MTASQGIALQDTTTTIGAGRAGAAEGEGGRVRRAKAAFAKTASRTADQPKLR